MKFEHTAALMLQSTAINSDRTKRAFAESIPVPDAREIAMAEFESAKHEISDAQYVERLDRITFDLGVGDGQAVFIGVKSESFSTITFSSSDDIKPLVIRHDVPLMWITRRDFRWYLNSVLDDPDFFVRLNKAAFHSGEYNAHYFWGD